jgi:hypothetical protein
MAVVFILVILPLIQVTSTTPSSVAIARELKETSTAIVKDSGIA